MTQIDDSSGDVTSDMNQLLLQILITFKIVTTYNVAIFYLHNYCLFIELSDSVIWPSL